MKSTIKKLLAFLILAGGIIAGAFSREKGGSGVERYAIFIGSNIGGQNNEKLLYAGTDAGAMQKTMTDFGGVAKENSILLLDPTKTEVDKAFKTISDSITNNKNSTGRSEFLFYYSGHSTEEALQLGRNLYPYTDLKNTISDIPSDVHVVILDSCYSGNFIRTKGGQKKKPFLVDDSSVVKGHAYLSSSSSKESSQESDEIKSSFFTNAMITGLKGAADTTGDKKVSLNELYSYAFNETLSKTESSATGPQHPNYNITLVGSGDLILSDVSNSETLLCIPRDITGRLIIRDKTGKLVSEVNKTSSTPVYLALEAGSYYATVISAEQTTQGDFTLRSNRVYNLSPSTLKPVERKLNKTRGGKKILNPPQAEYEEDLEDLEENSPSEKLDKMLDGDDEDFDKALRERARKNKNKVTDGEKNSRKEKTNDDEEEIEAYITTNSKTASQEIISESKEQETNEEVSEEPDPANLKRWPRFHFISFCPSLYDKNVATCLSFGLIGAGDFAVNGVQLGAVSNIAKRVNGIQASGVFNIASERVSGVQGSGVFNIAGKMNGAQGAGVFNIAGKTNGAQGAGVFNIAKELNGTQGAGVFNIAGNTHGVQGAGVFNIAGNLLGIQASGLFNVAKDVRGIQAASVVNVAHDINGVQVGLINVNNNCRGLMIGLLNISKNGVCEIACSYNSLGNLKFNFQSGSQYLYSILGVSSRADRLFQFNYKNPQDFLFVHAGIGTRVISWKFNFDFEGIGNILITSKYSKPYAYPSFRFSAGFTPIKHLNFFAAMDLGMEFTEYNSRAFEMQRNNLRIDMGKFALNPTFEIGAKLKI